jgi:hypothetical protein
VTIAACSNRGKRAEENGDIQGFHSVSFVHRSDVSRSALGAAPRPGRRGSGELAAHETDLDGIVSAWPVWRTGSKTVGQEVTAQYRTDIDVMK